MALFYIDLDLFISVYKYYIIRNCKWNQSLQISRTGNEIHKIINVLDPVLNIKLLFRILHQIVIKHVKTFNHCLFSRKMFFQTGKKMIS